MGIWIEIFPRSSCLSLMVILMSCLYKSDLFSSIWHMTAWTTSNLTSDLLSHVANDTGVINGHQLGHSRSYNHWTCFISKERDFSIVDFRNKYRHHDVILITMSHSKYELMMTSSLKISRIAIILLNKNEKGKTNVWSLQKNIKKGRLRHLRLASTG